MKRRYDFVLIILTVALLALLGGLCVYGTVHSFLASRADPGWARTPLYDAYVDLMNGVAYPLIIALLVVMGLCIPKRIVARRDLLWTSLIIVGAAGAVTITLGATAGLTFLLVTSAVLQGAVTVATILRRGNLFYRKRAFAAQVGSALLHLGFVLVVLDISVLEPAGVAVAMPMFWAATILMLIGITLTFYHREIFGRSDRRFDRFDRREVFDRPPDQLEIYEP